MEHAHAFGMQTFFQNVKGLGGEGGGAGEREDEREEVGVREGVREINIQMGIGRENDGVHREKEEEREGG